MWNYFTFPPNDILGAFSRRQRKFQNFHFSIVKLQLNAVWLSMQCWYGPLANNLAMVPCQQLLAWWHGQIVGRVTLPTDMSLLAWLPCQQFDQFPLPTLLLARYPMPTIVGMVTWPTMWNMLPGQQLLAWVLCQQIVGQVTMPTMKCLLAWSPCQQSGNGTMSTIVGMVTWPDC